MLEEAMSAVHQNSINNTFDYVNLTIMSDDIHELYRGFHEADTMMFMMPTILGGLFSRLVPEQITMEQMKLHKLTNMSNNHHFIGMSQDESIASNWSESRYIKIDPTLFKPFIIDVNKTFENNQCNFPERMHGEKEHVVIAMMYCSIKEIIIGSKKVFNPFYISIDYSNKNALNEFSKMYHTYIQLLRDKKNNLIDRSEEKTRLINYVNRYLQFYSDYAGFNNPFNLTMTEFSNQYPDFASRLSLIDSHIQTMSVSGNIGLFKNSPTLANYAMQIAGDIFQDHVFMKVVEKNNKNDDMTCYEDPYARPLFD